VGIVFRFPRDGAISVRLELIKILLVQLVRKVFIRFGVLWLYRKSAVVVSPGAHSELVEQGEGSFSEFTGS
jgi:hypothetical protein